MLMWRVLVGSWLFITIVGAIMIFPGPVPKKKLEGTVRTESSADRQQLINTVESSSNAAAAISVKSSE